MWVLVPFGATDPKSRLEPVLDPAERREFADLMRRDVVSAVRAAGADPLVVSTEPLPDVVEGSVRVDDRSLSAAVNDALRTHVDTEAGVDTGTGADTGTGVDTRDDGPELGTGGDGLAVLAADLGLVTGETVQRLLETAGDVVVAPGRGVGTNALVVRTPGFRVDYHGASYLDHCEAARRVGVEPTVVDSFRLATDVDEPDDLVEAFVHGDGRASDWLRDRFELDVGETGRVGLVRR